MTNVFLYGSLRHPELLELVTGESVSTLAPVLARLDGYRVVWAKGHGFPLIEARVGAQSEGVLLRAVSEDVLARLNHYELSFGFVPQGVTVQSLTDGAPEAAQVYFPKPDVWQAGSAWSLDDWVRDFWPLTRHSAREVMGYFGVLSGEEVAERFKMILTRAMANVLAEEEDVPTRLRSDMGRDCVKVTTEVTGHAGYFVLKTLHLRHRRFDGVLSDEMQREVFIAGEAATVLPYDPRRDRVLLIEQFRAGPYVRGDKHPWTLEPIAGRIDAFEDAATAVHREADEEAGVTLRSLEPIARFYATPGYSSEMLHSFIGITDLPDSAAGLGGMADEQEDIRSHVLSFAEAMRLIETGEANYGPLILSLLWLARERERLRAAAGM